jgi:REP element-mobilizing transposase RayT
MGHPLRCNLAGRLVEITCRTKQGRFLMRPSTAANEMIRGTLGRAQRYTGMGVCAATFMSNHNHLLLVPDSEKQLSEFMRFVNTNISKQLGALHNWKGGILARRFRGIPVSDEQEAQIARLRYILRHGVKEGLVKRPEDWPGVQSVSELLAGRDQIHGIWHERTAIWNAKQKGITLPREERMLLIAEIVAEIEDEARDRRRNGSRVLGVEKVRSQDPHDAPEHSKSSPAPVAHAATVETWLTMKIAYREFVYAYRRAAERAKKGLEARFPGGCFPPRGPYIPRDGPAWV